MKKILYLLDTLQTGGAERSLLEISTRLKNFEPIVCHIYPGNELEESFRQKNVKVFSLRLPGPYQFGKAISGVNELLRKIDPHIVHSTLFRSDFVSRFIDKGDRRIVNSLVSASYDPNRFKNATLSRKLKHKLVQTVDKLTAYRADGFISNSESIAKSNAQVLGIPPSKIATIYRGRDTNSFSTPVHQRIREEFGISSDTKLFLNVSRLLSTKGQDTLIKAFARFKDKYPQSFLIIAGEGKFRASLETIARAEGVAESVALPGNRTDIVALLNAADYFIFPSYIEGLPGSLIEAMMAGRTIVSSDIPENLECVNDSSAYIFRSQNEIDLYDKMMMAVGSTDVSMKKAMLAKEIAFEKFDIRKVAAAYDTYYERLITTSR